MKNINNTEILKNLKEADNNQLERDLLSGRDNKFCSVDCSIDLAPGSSKNCKGSSNNTQLDKELQILDQIEKSSTPSIESFVCRICHNSENSQKLVSPCLCKGTLTYVHINCLERWISTSSCTTCELCQFKYNTEQTLRYTLYQSLRLWYSRSMSRRALQEDCQMFSLLTLVAFGIVGTLLIAIQYYILRGYVSGFGRLWTKGWLIFFIFTTLVVYLINVYMIIKSQLIPWYRWWQSARDIRLVLENHKPPYVELLQLHKKRNRAYEEATATTNEMSTSQRPMKELWYQQNEKATEEAIEGHSHRDNYQGHSDGTYQYIIESVEQTLFLNTAASYNDKQHLVRKKDDDKKKKLPMPLLNVTTSTVTTTIGGNKSNVASTGLIKDASLGSGGTFDCIAVL